MNKIKVLTVFGTRPEAIKMAPVIQELSKQPKIFENIVCVTAQHREMLDQVLELFKIKPDYDLNIMKENQDLWTLTSNVLLEMKKVYEQVMPDIVLVHGDTTTTMAAALSAFYAKIPIGHVEAGLRTFNKFNPFPEEINRVFADAICDYHFAPTQKSVDNLKNTAINPNNIYLTGNTVIDALLYTVKEHPSDLSYLKLNPNLKTILLTTHRRENLGEPITNICHAVKELILKHKDIQFVIPMHLNPNVRKPIQNILNNVERVILTEPMEYKPFCTLMNNSYLILTDSGGVQEEAPSLGKPVLVLRKTTERPEAVEFGTAKLIGIEKDNIIKEVDSLLLDKNNYSKMAEATNPYGNGQSAKFIVEILSKIK